MLNLLEQLKEHDLDTYSHSLRVAELSLEISKLMNHARIEQNIAYYGGLLHDIGKLKINKEILTKPGKLSDYEWRVIQQHPIFGYELLNGHLVMESEVLHIVLFHHERINGSGYPFSLSGDLIPLNAQIISIADSFDAMTNNRSYSRAKSIKEAIEVLKSDCGYSPILLDTLIQVVNSSAHKVEELTNGKFSSCR